MLNSLRSKSYWISKAYRDSGHCKPEESVAKTKVSWKGDYESYNIETRMAMRHVEMRRRHEEMKNRHEEIMKKEDEKLRNLEQVNKRFGEIEWAQELLKRLRMGDIWRRQWNQMIQGLASNFWIGTQNYQRSGQVQKETKVGTSSEKSKGMKLSNYYSHY